jgi:lysophospholipase-3
MFGQARGSRPTRARHGWRLAVFGVLIAIVGLIAVLPAPVAAAPITRAAPTPIVLFPAFHFAKLQVTVRNQRVDTECPRFGTFQDFFPLTSPSTTFTQVCRDELLTLRYDPNPAKPMWLRFTNRPGVRVDLVDYGKTSSAPFYEPLYEALEAVGYVRNESIVVAGYDARLTPDMGGFMARTKRLIEDTYLRNDARPVHLVGHSNGPLYAQYLLTHVSADWKKRYIQGFTPIAGNFPGQGALYPLLFTGLNIGDFTFPVSIDNAVTSAEMYLSAPSSYMSAADPRIFGDRETVVIDHSTGRSYTPQDYQQLFADAGVPWVNEIADYYIGFVDFSDSAHFPNVDVYAEKGSGIDTLVGLGLHDLTVGQLLDAETEFLTRDGDINQEDITNDAVGVWSGMSCHRFMLTDNPGVDHFSLPSDAGVLERLIRSASRARSNCA